MSTSRKVVTKKCHFLNQQEMLTAVVKGRFIYTYREGQRYHIILDRAHGAYSFLLEHTIHVNIPLTETIARDCCSLCFEEVEVDWWDTLPDSPVLCYVWDDVDDTSFVTLVTRYSEDALYPFRNDYDVWKYAKPLTREEALKYVF